MLKQRILTALVLLPLMIGMLFFAGERLWAAFAGLIALLALWEYARICHMRAWQNALYLVISFCGGLYLYHSGFRFSLWQHAAVLVFWLLLVPLWLKYKWKVKADLWGALLGWVLLLPFWLALISLRPNTAAAGYLLAVAVAIPLGYAIGMSPLLSKALGPYIQLLKPISPLAWMPIALYTIKDANFSAIFVIFICSLWPMLMNTAFGVANVRKDWLNVAATLEVKPLRKAFQIILPAAAPAILTGMRISMGIAWLVIVAAEMLVGGTGIGYFVWNQWNNLSLGNVVFAVLMIGIVGMLLDMGFGLLQKKVSYRE